MRKKLKQLFSTKRRILAFGLGTTLALTTAGVALAYFAAPGAGTGSAGTATPSNLTIQQIGAGYDSLISTNGYHQDQCFSCAQISELGNDITLANPGSQQLVSVTVAMRNWHGNTITNLPMTFTIDHGIAGPVSDTQDFTFPPAIVPNAKPSVTNITFDFSAQGALVGPQFVYGIKFDPTFDSGAANGLNVALSSSANNLSVGTDTHPGTLYVDTTAGAGIAGDFPSCTTPGTGFASVITNCGPASTSNTGAYGTDAQVAAGNADIPAVEVNVVGGVTRPSLFPGGPAEPVDFAITNPGASTVHVSSVTTTVSHVGTHTYAGLEACTIGMYQLNNGNLTLNADVPTGTTLFYPSGVSIYMINDGQNQNNCEGETVKLHFASN